MKASVGCVRRVCLRRNAPLLEEFPVTGFLVVFGKMVRYAVANAPYACFWIHG